MAYDEKLAERIRRAMPPDFAISERKMMGGITFMIDRRMFGGVYGDSLLVRVGTDGYETLIGRPHVGTMEIGGKPLFGFVLVRPAGIKTARALAAWLERGLAYARALPAKPPKKPRRRPPMRAKQRRPSRTRAPA